MLAKKKNKNKKNKNPIEIPLQKESCTLSHFHCAEGLDVYYKIQGLNQNVGIREVQKCSNILHFLFISWRGIFCQ